MQFHSRLLVFHVQPVIPILFCSQINPVVTNMMSSDPQVVEVSRYLHDNKVRRPARGNLHNYSKTRNHHCL